MNLRRLVLFLLVPLLTLTAPDWAGATDCAFQSTKERVANAQAIIIGYVTAVDDGALIRSGTSITMPAQGIPHTLQVERIFKGDTEETLTIYQRWVLGAPNLAKGDRWLLFLYTDQFGNLSAGPCTPSMNLDRSQALPPDLAAALGPGWIPGGNPPDTTKRLTQAYLLTGALGLAGFGLYVLRRLATRT